MKSYTVKYTKQAVKALEKLDVNVSKQIVDWIENNLEGCENPRLHGKALQGALHGKWRYRIGDYRVVAEIEDDKVIILILDADHRRQIYR